MRDKSFFTETMQFSHKWMLVPDDPFAALEAIDVLFILLRIIEPEASAFRESLGSMALSFWQQWGGRGRTLCAAFDVDLPFTRSSNYALMLHYL